MEIRKSGSYYAPASLYSPRAVQPQTKSSIKFSGSVQRVKNPKIVRLEAKIADLEAKIKKDPAMLPEKQAEIKAEIDKAEMEIKSLPPTVELPQPAMQSMQSMENLSELGMSSNTVSTIDYLA